MNSWQVGSLYLRRLGILVLLGFAVTFLVGPVVALVSIVISLVLTLVSLALVFGLLGLLVWVPLRAFALGPQAAWKDACDMGKGLGWLMVVPFSGCIRVIAEVKPWARSIRQKTQQTFRFLNGIAQEVGSGALVGAVVGTIVGFRTDDFEMPIGVGMLAGALAGLLVAVSRTREAYPDQAPEGLH